MSSLGQLITHGGDIAARGLKLVKLDVMWDVMLSVDCGDKKDYGCFLVGKLNAETIITTPRMNPATCPNDVWALDFQFDSDFFGKTMKICNIVDEFTREHIAFTVNRMITAHDVTELLDVYDSKLKAHDLW